MFRIGLFMYLTLATVVGPGFCAFPDKLAWALSSISSHGENRTPQHCCQKKETPGKNDSSGQPIKPPCKCKEPRMGPTITKTSGQDVLNECKSFEEKGIVVAVLEMGRTILDISGVIENPRNPVFSFLEGQDILRAFHILLY